MSAGLFAHAHLRGRIVIPKKKKSSDTTVYRQRQNGNGVGSQGLSVAWASEKRIGNTAPVNCHHLIWRKVIARINNYFQNLYKSIVNKRKFRHKEKGIKTAP